MKNKQISLFEFDTRKDTASCNVCHANNHQSPLLNIVGKNTDRLYELSLGSVTAILCDDCLRELSDILTTAQSLPAQPTPPSNKPLTLEEMEKRYNGDNSLVWVVYGVAVLPAILDYCNDGLVAVWCADEWSALREKDCGTTWLAYASKPEEQGRYENWHDYFSSSSV